MSKKAVVGSLVIAVYFVCGLFLFFPKYDPVPDGFKLFGKGKLLWKESTQTLFVFQEAESLMLTISEPVIPDLVHRSSIPDGKLLLKVANGNPTSIYGLMSTSAHLMLINSNGIIVGPNAVFDVPGTTLSTLDIDPNDFKYGGENRFRGSGDVTNFGEIEMDDGDVVLLGRFVRPMTMDAGGTIIIQEKPKKTTAFEFEGLEEIK